MISGWCWSNTAYYNLETFSSYVQTRWKYWKINYNCYHYTLHWRSYSIQSRRQVIFISFPKDTILLQTTNAFFQFFKRKNWRTENHNCFFVQSWMVLSTATFRKMIFLVKNSFIHQSFYLVWMLFTKNHILIQIWMSTNKKAIFSCYSVAYS